MSATEEERLIQALKGLIRQYERQQERIRAAKQIFQNPNLGYVSALRKPPSPLPPRLYYPYYYPYQ